MNPIVANPVVQIFLPLGAVLVGLYSEWLCRSPGRFVSHVKQRADDAGASLRRIVRGMLVLPMAMLLFVTGTLLLNPSSFATPVGDLGALLMALGLASVGLAHLSAWPPAFLKRRWMDDFDEWWNQPGMAIHRYHADHPVDGES